MKQLISRKIAVGAALLLGLTACGSGTGTEGADGGTDYGVVPIFTPRQGGTAYILGGGISNLVSEHVDGVQASVEATTGTQEMVQRLEDRRSTGQPAFTLMDSAGTQTAYEGKPPYEQEYTELRALTFAGASDLYMVTSADSGIDSYTDLEGKRVGVGGPGSPTNILSTQIMAAHGVEEGDYQAEFLGYEDVVDGLSNGSIDAGVLAGSFPVSAYSELAAQHDVRIVPVQDDVLEALLEESPYFYDTVVEAGSYNGVEEDVRVLGFGTLVATHSETPDELVTDFMKVIFEQHEELVQVHGSAKDITLENATRGIGIPFHPAAEEYLKAEGVAMDQ